ncbi:hypothetical protein AFCA_004471 [Aspergillus flavus]|nr:hypothetical protein AFCA_004471 [Aspergillus flavus]
MAVYSSAWDTDIERIIEVLLKLGEATLKRFLRRNIDSTSNVVSGSTTSKTATFAPASASPRAKASPQPRAPPVTSAVRPWSEN